MKRFKDWKFDAKWIYVGLFIYLIIRGVEYSTGTKGTPEWIIDFFPYITPLIFNLCDNLLLKSKGEQR